MSDDCGDKTLCCGIAMGGLIYKDGKTTGKTVSNAAICNKDPTIDG